MNPPALVKTNSRQRIMARFLPGTVTTTLAVAVIIAGVGGAGYWYGRAAGLHEARSDQVRLIARFERERKVLEEANRESQTELTALAWQVGEVQAEILRLNALGERLVEMAGLDLEEFDFANPPPMGGPETKTEDIDPLALQGDTYDLLAFLDDRERKLERLEQEILKQELRQHTIPSTWPVRTGYISSNFGYRRHPIRKKTHFHSGVDIACKRGTPVLATADGVVTFSGWQSGYGRIVEIRHQDGLVTRYAHNQKNLVKKGERVEKGQTIAKVGSSGRSTGPHVHFEVRKDGKAVNPLKYVGTKPPKT